MTARQPSPVPSSPSFYSDAELESPPIGITIEVCVDSVQSAINAINGGADRLELCANLGVGGGTTPSVGLFKVVSKLADGLPMMVRLLVLIRPRAGDFLYSETEFEVMREDIRAFKRRGARGVVIGILTAEGRVDVDRTKVLVDEALPMEVCFHRAFDMTRDPDEALRDVLGIGGISRILTRLHLSIYIVIEIKLIPVHSGHGTSAPASLDTLGQLCSEMATFTTNQAFPTSILPGGGINAGNVRSLLSALTPVGVREIHLSGGGWVDGGMDFRRSGLGMGEWGVWTTDEGVVRQVREIADMFWLEKEA
ncbi:hypothetical protein ONZ45_g211 [Pleurotus djamor]|nr:hypothetical protein ONZ45_g211 [Pleurotus djamor]